MNEIGKLTGQTWEQLKVLVECSSSDRQLDFDIRTTLELPEYFLGIHRLG